MQTLLATLLSSRVPFVHFDEQATPRTVSTEARLLLGAHVDTRLEPLACVVSALGVTRRHTERVFRKTGVRTRTELARLMASEFGAIIRPSIGQHMVSLVDKRQGHRPNNEST